MRVLTADFRSEKFTIKLTTKCDEEAISPWQSISDPCRTKCWLSPATQKTQTSGGIFLPDSAKQKPQEGEVLAIGPGRILDDGSRSTLTVAVGDKVIYSKYGGTELKLDGQEYMILDEDQIYAVKG